MKAFDDNGNEMQHRPYCIICPAQYIETAREIGYAFYASIDVTAASMIATPLYGGDEITHYACFHPMWDNELHLMSGWIASQPHDWCSKVVFTIENWNSEMLGIIEASKEEFLDVTGLEV